MSTNPLLPILGAIAITLSLSAHANLSADGDVEVLSEAQLQEISATGQYFEGWCTWHADKMIREHWSGKYAKNGTIGADGKTKSWGDAKAWLANAKAAGLKTSMTPSKYAIAVYSSSDPRGHVAFVTGVDTKKKTYTITEMNWKGWNKVSTRTLSYDAGRIMGFIKKP